MSFHHLLAYDKESNITYFYFGPHLKCVNRSSDASVLSKRKCTVKNCNFETTNIPYIYCPNCGFKLFDVYERTNFHIDVRDVKHRTRNTLTPLLGQTMKSIVDGYDIYIPMDKSYPNEINVGELKIPTDEFMHSELEKFEEKYCDEIEIVKEVYERAFYPLKKRVFSLVGGFFYTHLTN